jgi:hypothetical protein
MVTKEDLAKTHLGIRLFFSNGDVMEFPDADLVQTEKNGYSYVMQSDRLVLASFVPNEVRGYCAMDVQVIITRNGVSGHNTQPLSHPGPQLFFDPFGS